MYGGMATQSSRERSIPDTEDTEKAQRATEKGEEAIYTMPHVNRLAQSGSWVGGAPFRASRKTRSVMEHRDGQPP